MKRCVKLVICTLCVLGAIGIALVPAIVTVFFAGEDGIKAGIWYELDEQGTIVPVHPDGQDKTKQETTQ